MLRKSLIPAALVALASASAFADSESSFYLGVKGLYFMPKDEISSDFISRVRSLGNADAKVNQSGGIFLPGVQFGYNVSDSIRVGLAGYFGANKFKFSSPDTFTADDDSAPRIAKHFDLGEGKCDNDSTVKDLKLELGPRFVALATMDMKVFESDSFSLVIGVGAGAAKWKASSSGTLASNAEDSSNGDKKVELGSKWRPAFMGTVNANIALGDVATLTLIGGYAHLGNPKGLKKDKNGNDFDGDANKAKGWIFGAAIGKEF